MAAAIRAIDKASVHRICSGQVILDLATAVKELVENSLDAGATSIEIKLKEHGGEMIEVSDNGCGVCSNNYQALTLKYHTSKLSDFSDLQSLTSFGFRGEALSSLCSLADVSIVTRTKDDETGTRVCYNRAGHIVSEEIAARQVGTTVFIAKLFDPLPVRRKEFTRNIRREYSRMLSILQAYAIISKKVRLVCTNLVGKSSRSTILRTQGGSIRENILTIFGPKTMSCLDPLDVSLSDDLRIEGFVSKPGLGSGRGSSDRQFFFVNGRPVEMPKFSKLLNELYKSFNSQQFPMAVLNFLLPTTAYDVNVTPDKRKLFLHSETSFLTGLRDALGRLYAPDKYTYMVHEVEEPPFEKSYMADLQTQVEIEAGCEETDQHKEHSEKSDQGDDDGDEKNDEDANGDESRPSKPLDFSAFSHDRVSVRTPARPAKVTSAGKKSFVQTKLSGFPSTKRINEVTAELLSEEPLLKKRAVVTEAITSTSGILETRTVDVSRRVSEVPNAEKPDRDSGGLLSEAPVLRKCMKDGGLVAKLLASKSRDHGAGDIVPAEASGKKQSPIALETDDDEGTTSPKEILDTFEEANESPAPPHTPSESSKGTKTNKRDSLLSVEDDPVSSKHLDVEDIHNKPEASIREVCFDINKVRSRIKSGLFQYNKSSSTRETKGRSFKAATVTSQGLLNDKEAALTSATKELERSFSKDDFNRMKVIGQFNLGFIVAKLDSDLFIIDQHASDEKYNFERLCKTTVLNRQPLLSPMPLHLSAAEEITISANMEIFRKNGFDFTEQENAAPGQRILLSAVPFSKNVTFGVPDVQELVSLLAQDFASNFNSSSDLHLVRPTRVRSMLASRACRSSIMIGDALSKRQMEKVISHLAGLDAPWNCPHGRPTMRHLYDLNTKKKALLSPG